MNHRPLHIAMIGTRGAGSTYGSVEKVVTSLAANLAARGHKIDVFSRPALPATDESANPRNIPTRALSGKYTETITRSIQATLKCIGQRYDILMYFAMGSSILTPLAQSFANRTIVSLHGLDWQRDKWPPFAKRFLKLAEAAAIRYADDIIVCSKAEQDYFRESYGRFVHFIPNGIPEPHDTDISLLKTLGLDPHSYVLLAGRLVPEKSVETAITAFKAINSSKRLIITGDNSCHPEYVQSLKDMADPKRILFTGHIHEQLLNTLFAYAYAYLSVSKVEGMSIALLQALGYRLPIIASDIPGNLDVVGETALIFRVGDAADLRTKLDKVLDDPEAARNLARRSAELVRSHLSWEAVAEAFEKVFFQNLDNNERPKLAARA